LESIDAEILEDPNPANTLACLIIDQITEFSSDDADYILNIVYQYLAEIGGDEQHKRQIVRKYATLILEDIRKQVDSAIKTNTTFTYQIKKASIIFGKQIKNIKPLGEVNLHKDITDKINIRKYIFNGYKKSYYEKNGFDSDAERKLSIVLENDSNVIRWIKPPLNQLGIFYSAGAQYNPDFLVETNDAKYMIEVKEAREIENKEVQLKKTEAELWCKYASIVDSENKKWKYRLISDKHIYIGETLNSILGLAFNPIDSEDKV
jgi:type III restriction enzyme